MMRKRFAEQQIIAVLREREAGQATWPENTDQRGDARVRQHLVRMHPRLKPSSQLLK
jgi:hypothetical protein